MKNEADFGKAIEAFQTAVALGNYVSVRLLHTIFVSSSSSSFLFIYLFIYLFISIIFFKPNFLFSILKVSRKRT